MIVQTCKYCHHSRVLVGPQGSQRLCVFNAPTLVMMNGPQGMMSAGGWPPVQDTDSCSKFEQEPILGRSISHEQRKTDS